MTLADVSKMPRAVHFTRRRFLADRPVVSRRSRLAKPPLSRDVIVAVALDLLDREGLAGLSLRRVAAALDTGPASFYVYLANLDELCARMLDKALGDVNPPEKENLPWRDRLKQFLLSYLRTLCARPELAHLALSTSSTGPNVKHILERLLGLWKRGGVDGARAAWGVELLTLYVTAVAAEQNNRSTKGNDLERVTRAVRSIKPGEFPLLLACQDAIQAGTEEQRGRLADFRRQE